MKWRELGLAGKPLLSAMAPLTVTLWGLLAVDTTASNLLSDRDGRYYSSGEVLLGDGSVSPVSRSLVLTKGRFQSMTQNSAVIVETSGRAETDLAGHVRLFIEERQVTQLSPDSRMNDELLLNLLYGRHRGSEVVLEPVGPCLYGAATRHLYCPDDYPRQ